MKVVLGFSGGVDSSVSAALLKQQGYEVLGLYMDNGGESALNDAINTAKYLDIPLKVADVAEALEQNVCRPFTEAYLMGETPNPCIICNPSVKFRTLCEYADEVGAEFIATGHYARARDGMLFKGRPENDQSYMLCRIERDQLKRLVLPLGDYAKTEVREMAHGFGIPVADKPDSMEICFIPDKDYIAWLKSRTELPPEGDFVFHGEVIGRHEGIHRYTVGQRRSGLFNGRKLYISRIVPESNTIELSLWEELFKTEVVARDFHWLCDKPQGTVNATVKVRHTKWENPPCEAYVDGELVRIHAFDALRAPARGQSAVLYDGERVLGGGFVV